MASKYRQYPAAAAIFKIMFDSLYIMIRVSHINPRWCDRPRKPQVEIFMLYFEILSNKKPIILQTIYLFIIRSKVVKE